MHIGKVIRKNREASGLTQVALAKKIGVSESMLRWYESGGKRVPHDVAANAAAVLRAPEICFAQCSGCPTNWLSVCLLKTDQHPSTEIVRVLHEAEEAVQAVHALCDAPLERVPREAVERACDQVLDLVPLAAVAVASWCRHYGIHMKTVHERHRTKMARRGYLLDEEDEAA